MVAFKDRTGDFTKKKHLYKFYKNGYGSKKPKYITSGQYMGGSGEFLDGGSNSGTWSLSGIYDNGVSVGFQGAGSNAYAGGTYQFKTDGRRKLDLKNIIISFSHGSGSDMYGTIHNYKIRLFDYEIVRNISANTIAFLYKGTILSTQTYSNNYLYLRMRERNGVLYIERSPDRQTWTAWTSNTIDFANDTLRSALYLSMSFEISGPSFATANVSEIEAVDRLGNLLAIESQVLSDLEFDESINNPASITSVTLPYSPLAVPAHCDEGNFVEIYTNFYDDGVIKNEPILDENNQPIQDQNGQTIYGVVLHGNVPEKTSILKFSGYINEIDYDYDNETITLSIVSHGETMANSLVRDGNTDVPIIEQNQQNSTITTVNRRQTFTLTKNTKIDAVRLRVQYTGGGGSSVQIGRGFNQVLATSNTFVWSGDLGETDLVYQLPKSLYLEAGEYWIRETYGINWRYMNQRVYTGGVWQVYTEGAWQTYSSTTSPSLYFALYTRQDQTTVALAGNSTEVANSIFEKSLKLDYSPIYLEEAQPTEYNINVGLSLDSAKNAVQALYRQLPTGWYYHVDVGTGGLRIKNKNAGPDHLLVFGRDFTEMKVTKDIDGIINDVYYIGAPLIENGPKLTVRSFDEESMSDLRQGLSIQSNDKVTRYDTAQLLSQNIIDNNNGKRITTEITLSAMKYNIETIRGGDVVKIVNGDRDVLSATLVVASLRYNPDSVTISLDSAPRNISRNIDQINRQLENMQTANASAVI